jgi:hypothetical protein
MNGVVLAKLRITEQLKARLPSGTCPAELLSSALPIARKSPEADHTPPCHPVRIGIR